MIARMTALAAALVLAAGCGSASTAGTTTTHVRTVTHTRTVYRTPPECTAALDHWKQVSLLQNSAAVDMLNSFRDLDMPLMDRATAKLHHAAQIIRDPLTAEVTACQVHAALP